MVDTIKFSEMTDGGDLANNEKTPGLLNIMGVDTNVLFNNPWTFLAPGTTGERPIPAASMFYRLRFNNTLEIYEYYDPTIPLWVELSGSGTGTVNPGVANDIAFYAASGQAVSPIAGAINSVLVTDNSGVPSLSTTLPSGLSIPGATITASTAALLSGSVVASPVAGIDLTNKTYVDGLFASGVTSITGTTNQILVNHPTGAVTLSLPQDIALGSTPTFAGLTLSSIPLSVASGGSGRASATAFTLLAGGTTSTAAHQSLTAGSLGQLLQSQGAGSLPNWTSAAFPVGPGTLNHLLRSDGTNWVESTNTTLNASDVLANLSQVLIGTPTVTGASQLQIAGVIAVGAGLISTYKNDTNGSALNILKSRSTTVGSKTTIVNGDDIGLISYFGDDGTAFTEGARIRVTATGAVSTGIVPTSFRFFTMDTSGALTLGMTLSNAQQLILANPLGLTSGGSNASLTASNGGIVYSTASAMAILAGTATAGQLLQSGANSAPSWTTATFPSGSGTLNHLLRSDGTNWVQTTATTLDASDVLSGLTQLNVDNLRLDGNTLSSTDTNGNLNYSPNGSGINYFDKNVFIGSSTSIGTSQLQVDGVNTTGAISISSFINTSSSPPALRLVKSRSIVVGSHVTVQNGDSLGSVSHFGDDGTSFVEAARIGSFVTGAVSTGIIPTEYRIFTMNTSGVLTQGMSMSNAQVMTLANPLALTSGGSNASLTASNGGIVYSTASAMAILAGTATAGQMLQSGASTTPAWSTSTYPTTNAINTLLYASSANVMAALATANSSVLVTSSGGVPSLSTALPSGLTATNMNLTTPTLGVASATSINFGGTALSNYTEGTWTPTDTSGAALSFTSVVGRYTRIGRLVVAQATLTYPATADASQVSIGSMPFAAANNNGALGGSIGFSSAAINTSTTVQPLVNTSNCRLYKGNTPNTNIELSGVTIYFTLIYTV